MEIDKAPRGPEEAVIESLLETLFVDGLDDLGWAKLAEALATKETLAAENVNNPEGVPSVGGSRPEALFATGLANGPLQRGVGERDGLRRYVETIILREALIDRFCPLDSRRPMGGDTPSGARAGAGAKTLGRLGGWSLGELAIAAGVALAAGLLLGLNAGGLRRDDVLRPGNNPIAIRSQAAPAGEQRLDRRAELPENRVVARPVSTPEWDRSLSQRDRMGVITGLSPEASADGLLRSMQVGETLRCGEVVQVVQGVARLGLADGPELLVEGPAECSIIGSGAVFLRYGRLHASSQAGCLVQTPELTIEGAGGTKLAVVAEQGALVRVHSFQGNVGVFSNARRNAVSRSLASLGSGQGIAVSVGVDRALTVVADSEPPQVIANWEQVQRNLHPYEAMVIADNPLAYWPLHHVRRNRRVLDLTQHGYDGQAIGNWPAERSAFAEDSPRGARFDGESYIEPDRKPPVNLRKGFTIESWAKVAGGPEFQSIFTSRWVFASNTPTQQCFGFTLYAGDDDRWEFWCGSGEYGAPWQELVTPKKLRRYHWTHVAATFEPTRVEEGQYVDGLVRMHIDGRAVAEGIRRMSLMDFEWPARIGAAEFVPRSLTSWLFVGELRDIALYNHVLADERLGEHFRVGSDEG